MRARLWLRGARYRARRRRRGGGRGEEALVPPPLAAAAAAPAGGNRFRFHGNPRAGRPRRRRRRRGPARGAGGELRAAPGAVERALGGKGAAVFPPRALRNGAAAQL